jgi:hypothetical protein
MMASGMNPHTDEELETLLVEVESDLVERNRITYSAR